MGKRLIDFEDQIYHLYARLYPKGQSFKTDFDALQSETRKRLGLFPEATARTQIGGQVSVITQQGYAFVLKN
jgi:hypothetical protein